jgi:SAM-dependent methyltransferase
MTVIQERNMETNKKSADCGEVDPACPESRTPNPDPRFVRRNAVVGFYSPRVGEFQESHEILDWGSRDSQFARFDVLSKVIRGSIRNNRFSVLDVGCGLADLEPHLRKEFPSYSYFGADVTLEILREAQRRRPGLHLVNADSFHSLPFRSEAFDYLFCSGVFNLESGDNERELADALPILGSSVSIGVVINFLHCRVREPYAYCHYYDPDVVASVARNAFPDAAIAILDGYLENDFTLRVLFPSAKINPNLT